MLGRILAIAALCACNGTKSPAPSGTPPPTKPAKLKPACDLISVDEVGKLAATLVTIDPAQSGPDASGDEHCAYMHGRDTVLVLSVIAASSWDHNKADAFSAANPPVAITDLADEALYAEFKNGSGSNLLVRRGPLTIILGGNQRRDPYVAMAKLAISRL